jgi:hypothetical protein
MLPKIAQKCTKLLIALGSTAACYFLSLNACYAEKNFLVLSSGTPPPLAGTNVMIKNGGAGASAAGQPPDMPGFSASIGFGDLAQVTNGAPAEAAIGLRLRGDQNYVVTVSQISMIVTNLQFRGVDLQGSSDRGSFLRLGAGTVVGTGNQANPTGSNINAVLYGDGLGFNQIAQGSVNASSTQVIAGSSPSMGGSMNSANNAIEFAVIIVAPTGLALGPTVAGSPGTFSSILQFGVFPLP